MNQPYIFNKQIISLIILFLLLITSNYIEINDDILHVISFYTILILSVTFTPSIKKYIRYPMIIHIILYYTPFILPKLFQGVYFDYCFTLSSIIWGTLTGTLLLLSNIRHTKEYVSAKNYTTLSPINVANLVNEILSYILAIVGEEIFFRYFLINSMTRYIGIYVIPMGGILFTLTHYLNRWANIIFNVRSYIYHTIIGLVLGGIYYLTGSICGCIISHLIFNSPELVILYKRYKVRIHEDVQLFDDYN